MIGRRCVLVMIGGLVTWLWLGVFPGLSRRSGAPLRIERQERRGIDPSAMFYSDLPMMLDSARTDAPSSPFRSALED